MSVFVGRHSELDALHRGLEQARTGHLVVVALDGDPGSGKTALLDHFAEQVRPSAGDRVVRVHCRAGRTGLPPAVALPDSFGAAHVYLVDEAEYCDDEMAALFGEAMEAHADGPLLLVIAGRPPLPREPHPLGPVLATVSSRLSLGGLTPLELLQLARTVTDTPLTPMQAERLWAETSGNPLYALSLLRTLAPSALDEQDGPWLPPRCLVDAATARTGTCSSGSLSLLRWASVLGPQFNARDLETVARRVDFEARLDELIEAALLQEVPGTAGRLLEFDAAWARATVYLQMPRSTRRELHTAAALLLVGEARTRHQVAAFVAPERQLAAQAEQFARDDLARGQLGRAELEARTALRLTPRGPRRRSLCLLAADILLLARQPSAACVLLEQGRAPEPDAWWAYVYAHYQFLSGRLRSAQSLVQQAEAELRSGHVPPGAAPDLAARIAALQCRMAAENLDADAVRRFGSAALTAQPPGWGGHLAAMPLVIGLVLTGHRDEAFRRFETLARRDEEPASSWLVARSAMNLWADELSAADADLRSAFDRAKGHEHLDLAQALAFSAELCRRTGRLSEAVEQADLAMEVAVAAGRRSLLPCVAAIAACSHSAAGQLPAAHELAGRASREARLSNTPLANAWAATAWSCVAHATDDLELMERAGTELVTITTLREPGFSPLGPIAVEVLARTGRTAEARRALEQGRQMLAGVHSPSASANLDRLEGIFFAANHNWEQAASAFRRSVATAEGSGLALSEALAHSSWGRHSLEDGDHQVGERELSIARAQFEYMGAVSYAARSGDLLARARPAETERNHPVPDLTRSERAVVGLLASGLSNADIARQLVVSVKTVEYHLTHIYAKFGVRSRLELVSMHHEQLDGASVAGRTGASGAVPADHKTRGSPEDRNGPHR